MIRPPYTPFLLLAFAGATASVAAADFETGQSADVVLGKSNFASSTPSTASATNISFSRGIFFDDASGRLFVSDTGNNRVLRFSSTAAAMSGASADAVFGQPDATSSTANNGGLSASSMSSPDGICVDFAGRLWVADFANNRVLRFDKATADLLTPATFVADQVLGQPNFASNLSGTTSTTMSFPTGVCVDSTGNLYVTEQGNSRVSRFDSPALLGNGGASTRVFGQPNKTTGASGTTNAKLKVPSTSMVDSQGRLWVADQNNARVMRFDNAATAPADGPAADGVLGQLDFMTATTGTSRTKFNDPEGVFVDAAGRLYLTEFSNHRIIWFDDAANKPNGAPADGVLGQPDFESNTSSTTAGTFQNPWTAIVTASGKLWVADGSNNRALRFSPVPASAPILKLKGRRTIVTSKAKLKIKGIASGDSLARVEARVGKGPFEICKGTKKWKFKTPLELGVNKIQVRAVNADGIYSSKVRVKAIRQ